MSWRWFSIVRLISTEKRALRTGAEGHGEPHSLLVAIVADHPTHALVRRFGSSFDPAERRSSSREMVGPSRSVMRIRTTTEPEPVRKILVHIQALEIHGSTSPTCLLLTPGVCRAEVRLATAVDSRDDGACRALPRWRSDSQLLCCVNACSHLAQYVVYGWSCT